MSDASLIPFLFPLQVGRGGEGSPTALGGEEGGAVVFVGLGGGRGGQ